MLAIASLLDPGASQSTQKIWDQLENQCGLSGVKLTPRPHFSWQSAGIYDIDRVESALQEIALETGTFYIETSGLGIFTGLSPILYLTIVKTELLLNLHKKVWKAILPYSENQNAYYGPDSWIPHITLAYRDVTSDALACAIPDIVNLPLKMTITVDNFVVIYQIDNAEGIRSRFTFSCKAIH